MSIHIWKWCKYKATCCKTVLAKDWTQSLCSLIDGEINYDQSFLGIVCSHKKKKSHCIKKSAITNIHVKWGERVRKNITSLYKEKGGVCMCVYTYIYYKISGKICKKQVLVVPLDKRSGWQGKNGLRETFHCIFLVAFELWIMLSSIQWMNRMLMGKTDEWWRSWCWQYPEQ